MTGYTVHTGSSMKFSSGWDRIFEGKKSAKKSPENQTAQTRESERSTKRPSTNSVKKAVAATVKKTVRKTVNAVAKPKAVKRGK